MCIFQQSTKLTDTFKSIRTLQADMQPDRSYTELVEYSIKSLSPTRRTIIPLCHAVNIITKFQWNCSVCIWSIVCLTKCVALLINLSTVQHLINCVIWSIVPHTCNRVRARVRVSFKVRVKFRLVQLAKHTPHLVKHAVHLVKCAV